MSQAYIRLRVGGRLHLRCSDLPRTNALLSPELPQRPRVDSTQMTLLKAWLVEGFKEFPAKPYNLNYETSHEQCLKGKSAAYS